MSISQNTTPLAALLDVFDTLPGAPELRARTYDLLGTGDRPVVDVGCGAGRAVAELSARGVPAIGVDRDEQMIATGRSRHPGADLRVGDAGALPLADGEAGGYRADKVFHDLADPAAALAEARRVLARGGRAVLIGQDWDTLVIDAADGALTRAVVHARADRVTAPRSARAYRALLLDAGFADVTVEVHTLLLPGPEATAMLGGFAAAATRP
ncbi:methyltransferase domain-containing protein [Actinomadura hibisca]|uniref:methyltransferase domain-containing protein n=1 Tax=Actinomadura hibisca TaxID=68565 RepID=UPI00083390AC|nr:methyltransferase domain-containing protein [Actinomadura hibisca]